MNRSEKSIIYIVPSIVRDDALNSELYHILRHIENRNKRLVRNHLLSSIWGAPSTKEIMRSIPAGTAHSIVSTTFARTKNDRTNYFEIAYKMGCDVSHSVALRCGEVAMTRISKLNLPHPLRPRIAPAMSYHDGISEPNPLFESAKCFGLIIEPFYYSCPESEGLLRNEGFMDAYTSTLETAIRAFDEYTPDLLASEAREEMAVASA
jgi:hypothetical protein